MLIKVHAKYIGMNNVYLLCLQQDENFPKHFIVYRRNFFFHYVPKVFGWREYVVIFSWVKRLKFRSRQRSQWVKTLFTEFITVQEYFIVNMFFDNIL